MVDKSTAQRAPGAGTFDDASPVRLLGVDAGGYVVEVTPGAGGVSDNLADNGDDFGNAQ